MFFSFRNQIKIKVTFEMLYLAGNDGKRPQLRRIASADVDGPEPKATIAGRLGWTADRAGSFRLDRDYYRPSAIVRQVLAVAVEGS